MFDAADGLLAVQAMHIRIALRRSEVLGLKWRSLGHQFEVWAGTKEVWITDWVVQTKSWRGNSDPSTIRPSHDQTESGSSLE